MKIMVFGVPAESGGALSILNYIYNEAKLRQDIDWIFILSKPKLEETQNIKTINFNWIKKSWFHRIYFELFIAHKYVEKYNPDYILTLHNMIIFNTNVNQILYMQQSIPFTKIKFNLFKDPKLWIHQNITSRFIKKSIKNASTVIVQTEWIKNIIIEELNVDKNKILLDKIKIQSAKIKSTKNVQNSKTTFFYPAIAASYKNHEVIIDALLHIDKKYYNKLEIIFTITEKDNLNAKKLYSKIIKNKLPVKFIGRIDKETVNEYYSKSYLIFPSKLETLGLPLVEARNFNKPIIASDTLFSREALSDYKCAYYFENDDAIELSNIIMLFINKKQIVEGCT